MQYKPWLLGSSLLLVLAGCATGRGQGLFSGTHADATPPLSWGNIVLTGQLGGNRTVQYLASDIGSMKVSVLDAGNANSVVASTLYSGSSLASHLVSNAFTFQVDNLLVDKGTTPYSYNVRVDAYLDTSGTIDIGTAQTASPFAIATGQTTTLTSFPALQLIPTPVGNATATGSNAVTIVDATPPPITFN